MKIDEHWGYCICILRLPILQHVFKHILHLRRAFQHQPRHPQNWFLPRNCKVHDHGVVEGQLTLLRCVFVYLLCCNVTPDTPLPRNHAANKEKCVLQSRFRLRVTIFEVRRWYFSWNLISTLCYMMDDFPEWAISELPYLARKALRRLSHPCQLHVAYACTAIGFACGCWARCSSATTEGNIPKWTH